MFTVPAGLLRALGSPLEYTAATDDVSVTGSRVLIAVPHLLRWAKVMWHTVRPESLLDYVIPEPTHGVVPYVILRKTALEEDTGLDIHTDLDGVHSDGSDACYTVLLCLTDIDEATGAIKVWPDARDPKFLEGAREIILTGKAGDGWVFNSTTWHQPMAASVFTGQTMQFIVTRDGAPLGEPEDETDEWDGQLQSDQNGAVTVVVHNMIVNQQYSTQLNCSSLNSIQHNLTVSCIC